MAQISRATQPPVRELLSIYLCDVLFFFFFFFQAEDGIRDLTVTGVQTCALPIWPARRRRTASSRADFHAPRRCSRRVTGSHASPTPGSRARARSRSRETDDPPGSASARSRSHGAGRQSPIRSEERRVGKEGR